jgi:RNA polymerase sigma-70 factor, ECF subfamily
MSEPDAQQIERLIARVALGDRAAFSALYAVTSAKLFGVCLRITSNRAEAEDALQEAYVKIWNKAGTFAPSGRSAFGWLASIARNQAIDLVRQKRGGHVEIGEALEVADDAPSAETAMMAKDDAGALQRCLAELDARRAEALRFAYVEGWSYQEIATHADMPLNTVRTWLRRGLMALKECMQR